MGNGLELTNFEALNNHLCDVNGIEYSAKDYFKNYENGMKNQINKFIMIQKQEKEKPLPPPQD